MSNTRHIANKPLDWQVRPRPPREGLPAPPVPPPVPPPPPPPPGIETQVLGATVYGAGKANWTVWTSRVSCAVAVNFFIVNDQGNTVQEVTYYQVRPNFGSVLSFRADCSDWEYPPQYIGGPNHPSPFGNVPEGGSIVVRKIGYIYIVRGYSTLAFFRYGLRLYTSCAAIGNIFGGSLVWESPSRTVIGSGFYPNLPVTRMVHYHTVMFDQGSITETIWNPTAETPDPPPDSFTAERIEWLRQIPI